MAVLDPRPGDVFLLLRDAGDPASLDARLRRFVKRLGRAYGVEVIRIEEVKDLPPAGAAVREESTEEGR